MATFAARLLGWYDRHRRELPWRTLPEDRARGVRPDPYHVWLSEVMLQQTTVEAVKAYYTKFVGRWPTVGDLAAAQDEDVMKAWAGLGYYSRARNLRKCAIAVVHEHGGRFPEEEQALRTLPGIGAYTAAAIAAIAFDRTAIVIDGNVERVMTRHAAIADPMPGAKKPVAARLEALVERRRPGDFAQAMMDLGATVCTPRRPACTRCPVVDDCAGLASGDPQTFPVKAPKRERPFRRGAAFVAVNREGAILLRRRPATGLLGGMSEVPTTGWNSRIDGATDAGDAPFTADWQRRGAIRHVFTHFELELSVYRADVGTLAAPSGHWWSPSRAVAGEALPTVMKKVIEAAIPGATRISRRDPAT